MKGAKDWREMIGWSSLWLAAGLSVLSLGAILWYILSRGLSAVSLEFLTQAPRRLGSEGGIFPTIVSTLYVTAVAMAMAVPVSLGTAIYLREYMRPSPAERLIRFSLQVLAGIPSIVFGLFGFTFFVIKLRMGFSVVAGGLTLAIMVLPTLIRAFEEAIATVPREYREASLALGADRWQTVRRIVLPTANPGLLTGMVLAIGRAVGESAAVILTAGSAMRMPVFPTDQARTMTVHLYILATEGLSDVHAYGTAAVLIVMVLLLNQLTTVTRARRRGEPRTR